MTLFPTRLARWGALLLAAVTLPVAAESFDVLIVNARIVDGGGNPWYRGSVGVRDGRIVAVGRIEDAQARRTIDAADRVVAPGFIDLMAQDTVIYLTDPVSALSELRQGVTTHISGEGASAAPQNERTMSKPVVVDGKPVRWSSYAEYFQILERKGLPINVAYNVGAAQVREVVMGEGNREPKPAELEKMKALVEQAMRDGAHGISTSLIYPPGAYAKTEELIELSKVAARFGGFYSTHMRNESSGLLPAIDEALRIGREAGIPVHIYHLKAAGKRNWPLMAPALRKIAAARADGQDVTADIYPYIRNGLGLISLLPPSHFTQGSKKAHDSLSDPAVRRKLKAILEQPDGDWENWYQHVGADWDKVQITGTGSYDKSVDGMSIAAAARKENKDPWDMFFDLAQADAGCAPESMNEEQKQRALRAPFVMVETDNGPMNPADGTVVHPRAFGAFPRLFAKYVREDGVLTMEEAVRRSTSMVANRVGLLDRGRIAPGMAADLVIFHPDRIRDVATFENPLQYSEGLDYVMVNGGFAIDDGKATGANVGRVLRHRQATSVAGN
jgi:N-acyl-D-amino-acid deacylase